MKRRLRPIGQQVMVITGASSGIGLLTACKAAEAGAKVVLIARNELALRRAVQEITACGDEAIYAVADVGVPEEVAAAAQLAVDRFGRIDTWVNDAGVAIYAMLSETPIEEHERLFRTNYFGVVNGSNAALPYLRKSGGALITVGSIASDLPSPLLGAYTASKHAVKGFIDCLRIELATEGIPISVTLVKPAGMDTPIGRHAANHRDREALIPPPVYDPEIVADTILYVAQHPRREITVGGIGRANVLIGTHFPRLLEHLAPLLIPLLTDRHRPPTPDDNLSQPGHDGEVRSGVEQGRRFSLYTSAARHRAITGIGLGAMAGMTALLLARRR